MLCCVCRKLQSRRVGRFVRKWGFLGYLVSLAFRCKGFLGFSLSGDLLLVVFEAVVVGGGGGGGLLMGARAIAVARLVGWNGRSRGGVEMLDRVR